MPKRILLVEDDRISRESLSKLLTEVGHNVMAVWSAEEAKAAITAFDPQVALLDIRLPGLPGDAFAIYLRHKCPSAKIIFVSGEFWLEQEERFGPNAEYISKPLNMQKLLQVIEADSTSAPPPS